MAIDIDKDFIEFTYRLQEKLFKGNKSIPAAIAQSFYRAIAPDSKVTVFIEISNKLEGVSTSIDNAFEVVATYDLENGPIQMPKSDQKSEIKKTEEYREDIIEQLEKIKKQKAQQIAYGSPQDKQEQEDSIAWVNTPNPETTEQFVIRISRWLNDSAHTVYIIIDFSEDSQLDRARLKQLESASEILKRLITQISSHISSQLTPIVASLIFDNLKVIADKHQANDNSIRELKEQLNLLKFVKDRFKNRQTLQSITGVIIGLFCDKREKPNLEPSNIDTLYNELNQTIADYEKQREKTTISAIRHLFEGAVLAIDEPKEIGNKSSSEYEVAINKWLNTNIEYFEKIKNKHINCQPIDLNRNETLLWFTFYVWDSCKNTINKSSAEYSLFVRSVFYITNELLRAHVIHDSELFLFQPFKFTKHLLRLIEVHTKRCLEVTIPQRIFERLARCYDEQESHVQQFESEHLQHVLDVYTLGIFLIEYQAKTQINSFPPVLASLLQLINIEQKEDENKEQIINIKKVFALAALCHNLGMLNDKTLSQIKAKKPKDLLMQLTKDDIIVAEEAETIEEYIKSSQSTAKGLNSTQSLYSAVMLSEFVDEIIYINQADQEFKEDYTKITQRSIRAILFHSLPTLSNMNAKAIFLEPTAALLVLTNELREWTPNIGYNLSSQPIQNGPLNLVLPIYGHKSVKRSIEVNFDHTDIFPLFEIEVHTPIVQYCRTHIEILRMAQSISKINTVLMNTDKEKSSRQFSPGYQVVLKDCLWSDILQDIELAALKTTHVISNNILTWLEKIKGSDSANSNTLLITSQTQLPINVNLDSFYDEIETVVNEKYRI